jgi:hypothetical protein
MIIRLPSMKRFHLAQAFVLAAMALCLFALSTTAGGADAKARPELPDGDAMPAETPAPKSVFDLTLAYKDPFFPNSTRHRVQVATNVVINTCDPKQYTLKGISGVPGQEVVIINDKNAAAGESIDVMLQSGTRVMIKVISIAQHSATILPEGQHEPVTISLPKEDW